jgi:glutamate-1-semialdehyde aminotransferase
MRKGLNDVFMKHDFPATAVGCGSIASVGFGQQHIETYYDFQKSDMNMLYKWHMWLATRYNIYTYPGVGAFFISAVHTDEEIDAIITATEEFVKMEKKEENV